MKTTAATVNSAGDSFFEGFAFAAGAIIGVMVFMWMTKNIL